MLVDVDTGAIPDYALVREGDPPNVPPEEGAFWQNRLITGAVSGEVIDTEFIPLSPTVYQQTFNLNFALFGGDIYLGPLYDEATGALLTPSGGPRYGVQISEDKFGAFNRSTVIEQEYPVWSDPRAFLQIAIQSGGGFASFFLGLIGSGGPGGTYAEQYTVSATVADQDDVDALISDAMAAAAAGSVWADVTSGPSPFGIGYGVFFANKTPGLPCYPFPFLTGAVTQPAGQVPLAVGAISRPSPFPAWVNGESVSVATKPEE